MLWTTAKLAKATGLTKRHVARLAQSGSLRAEKVGHDWIILDEDAQKFIEEHKKEAKAKEN